MGVLFSVPVLLLNIGVLFSVPVLLLNIGCFDDFLVYQVRLSDS